ncbi:hypothetical protein H8959_016399 [Pygathrix nigripes]
MLCPTQDISGDSSQDTDPLAQWTQTRLSWLVLLVTRVGLFHQKPLLQLGRLRSKDAICSVGRDDNQEASSPVGPAVWGEGQPAPGVQEDSNSASRPKQLRQDVPIRIPSQALAVYHVTTYCDFTSFWDKKPQNAWNNYPWLLSRNVLLLVSEKLEWLSQRQSPPVWGLLSGLTLSPGRGTWETSTRLLPPAPPRQHPSHHQVALPTWSTCLALKAQLCRARLLSLMVGRPDFLGLFRRLRQRGQAKAQPVGDSPRFTTCLSLGST